MEESRERISEMLSTASKIGSILKIKNNKDMKTGRNGKLRRAAKGKWLKGMREEESQSEMLSTGSKLVSKNRIRKINK